MNKHYLGQNQLNVELMGRGYAWLDTGTHDSLVEASEFVRTIQKRQGVQVACLEEIAYLMGYISGKQVLAQAEKLGKTSYSQYLKDLVIRS